MTNVFENHSKTSQFDMYTDLVQYVNLLFCVKGSVIFNIFKHYNKLYQNNPVFYSRKNLPDGFFGEVRQKGLVTNCILKR